MLEYSVIVLDHFRNAESTPQCLPAQRRIFNILHLNFNTSTINNIMVNSCSAIEDRIDSAIDALHDGLYTSLTIGK